MSDSRYHIFFDNYGNPVARINEATLGLSSRNADLLALRRFFADQLPVSASRPERWARMMIERAVRDNDDSVRWSAPTPVTAPAAPAESITTAMPAPIIAPMNVTTTATSTTQSMPAIAQTAAIAIEPAQPSSSMFTEEQRKELIAETEAREKKASDEVLAKYEAMIKKRDDLFKKGGNGAA